jgi:hypothetical protein
MPNGRHSAARPRRGRLRHAPGGTSERIRRIGALMSTAADDPEGRPIKTREMFAAVHPEIDLSKTQPEWMMGVGSVERQALGRANAQSESSAAQMARQDKPAVQQLPEKDETP